MMPPDAFESDEEKANLDPRPDNLSLLVFFIRHGERLDQIIDFQNIQVTNSIDPQLTKDGKMQAIEAGCKMFLHVRDTQTLNDKYMPLILNQLFDVYLDEVQMQAIREAQLMQSFCFTKKLRQQLEGNMDELDCDDICDLSDSFETS